VVDPLTVDVQPTPNINALKFVVNRRLTDGRSQTYRSPQDAAASPLAASLLGIPGVVQVFVLNDFITLTRAPGADWGPIVDQADRLIREHLAQTDR
jgi:hypothetical protein